MTIPFKTTAVCQIGYPEPPTKKKTWISSITQIEKLLECCLCMHWTYWDKSLRQAICMICKVFVISEFTPDF